MVTVTSLWLAVLLSAVLVFVVSAILHMGPFWHRNDYPKVPDEDGLMNAVRPFNLPVGDYFVPRASSGADMKNPAFLEKLARGPILAITVRPPGPPAMAGSLAKWFVHCVVVSLFVAYVVTRALPAGAGYLQVHQIAGSVAFAAYAFAVWPISIWYGRGLRLAVWETVDALILASLVGGTFGWAWPAA